MSDKVASVHAKRASRKIDAAKRTSSPVDAVKPSEAAVEAAASLPRSVVEQTSKPVRKAAGAAKAATNASKPVVRGVKPIAKTARPEAQPIDPAPPTPEPAVAALDAMPLPAAAIEFMEAAMSPAGASDTNPAEPETLASIARGKEKMATVATDNTAFASDKLQSLFGDVGARFKAGFEKSTKMGEEMVDLAKGNVEAVVASARVAAKGSETIGQDAAAYGKKSFENAVAAMKGFASVKSPTELFQLQSDFAKASFDSAVAEASKFSESMMKLAGEVAQPLSSRYAVAAEKIKAVAL